MSTTKSRIKTSPLEWNASLHYDYLWSNVNFGEAVTDVMTPLTWSVIEFTLVDWVFIPGIPTVAQIGGYPYLNISAFATIFHLMGRSREDLLSNLESTLYMALPEDVEIPLVSLNLKHRISSLISSIKIQMRQRQGIKALPSYLEGNLAFFNSLKKRINRQDEKIGLLSLWSTSLQPHLWEGVWCVLGSASHASDFTMKLQRDLVGLINQDDAQRLIANLSGSSYLLPSLGPVIGLDKVARGEWSREQYLFEFGHRGPHEFELSAPRPAEDPSWLEKELEQWNFESQDLTNRLSQQQDSFEAALNRLGEKHQDEEKGIRRRIEESARRGRLREEARSAYVRDRWLVRLFALKASELTGVGEDIFFHTLDEVIELLKGSRVHEGTIQERKKTYAELKTLPPFPSVIRGSFDPFLWAEDSDRSEGFYIPGRAKSKKESWIIHGSPGSAGIVKGKIRRLESPEDGHQLQQGEIMLALQTDIAWTVLFPRAAAVVTDIGAPLSHAAIVARELGIPAVVGCGNAMSRLKTGDLVQVDGARGLVEIIHN